MGIPFYLCTIIFESGESEHFFCFRKPSCLILLFYANLKELALKCYEMARFFITEA